MSNLDAADPVEPTQEQVRLLEDHVRRIFSAALDSAIEATMAEFKNLVGGNMSIDAAMRIICGVAKEEVARLAHM
jgi:hypothetical protein